MQETEILTAIYQDLLAALEANADEPAPMAAQEVLSPTGAWLSRMDNQQLVILQRQINNQLAHNMLDD